nr:MAG TPA: Muramidase (flagellum-specific) [Caudoviricetes sp.]
MKIERMIAKTHCYLGQNKPSYVVVHETDNWSKGANAHAHATAMKNGNLAGTVHYYVDSQECYQTLEHQDGAWAVGDGHGRYGISNLNSINIEICVNPESNYYLAVDRAAELAAMLLNQYGWDTSHLKRHYDASRKHCPRRILDEGLWDNFVKCTASYMKKQGSGAAPAAAPLYRVRKTWKDSKSQVGAYAVLDNAKKNCPSGYSVYDETGKVIYTNKSTEPVRRNGLQATELKGLNSKELIEKIGPLFTADQKKSGVLASVSMAQFILESGWGKSGLTQKANNAFGMKKNLSGNTWPNSAWDGKSVVSMQTGEETEDGKAYTITAEFRQYNCIEDSIADHSAYLTGAKDGDKLRYEGLKGCKKYKQAAQIIKNGGYATSTSYVKALCDIIKEYSLTDYEVKKKATKPATATKPAAKTFKVKVSADDLRIRKEPNLHGEIVGYTGKGIFTITEEKDGWGKLKSGAGWICLTVNCVKRV